MQNQTLQAVGAPACLSPLTETYPQECQGHISISGENQGFLTFRGMTPGSKIIIRKRASLVEEKN